MVEKDRGAKNPEVADKVFMTAAKAVASERLRAHKLAQMDAQTEVRRRKTGFFNRLRTGYIKQAENALVAARQQLADSTDIINVVTPATSVGYKATRNGLFWALDIKSPAKDVSVGEMQVGLGASAIARPYAVLGDEDLTGKALGQVFSKYKQFKEEVLERLRSTNPSGATMFANDERVEPVSVRIPRGK